jgi:phytoene synthase
MRNGDPGYVESLVRRSGTSFFWAMRLLPEAKRLAMFAVYAFCREVDDIADEPGDTGAKLRQLDGWRDEIDRLYAGKPQWPVTRALGEAVGAFDLRKVDFLAVIDGMQMDAADSIRLGSMDELLLYCDRVACAVGRLSVRVFGVPAPDGDRLANAQGQALQLTNILRDLDEDAERDRLYLPADLLRAHGITETDDARQVLRQAALADVCEELAVLAERRFDEAMTVLAVCDRRQVRPARIMLEVYRRTLRQLLRRGWERWNEPVSVSSAEKLWVALRYGLI